jgi:hypothetical protein
VINQSWHQKQRLQFVKIHYNGDIRCISLIPTTFKNLKDQINKMYPIVEMKDTDIARVIKYQDDEKDLITLKTTQELLIALKGSSTKMLKIFVTDDEVKLIYLVKKSCKECDGKGTVRDVVDCPYCEGTNTGYGPWESCEMCDGQTVWSEPEPFRKCHGTCYIKQKLSKKEWSVQKSQVTLCKILSSGENSD